MRVLCVYVCACVLLLLLCLHVRMLRPLLETILGALQSTCSTFNSTEINQASLSSIAALLRLMESILNWEFDAEASEAELAHRWAGQNFAALIRC